MSGERNTLRVPFGAWYREEELELPVPASWEVHHLEPEGAPAIDDEAIARAFAEPLGAPPLRELAAGKASAVVAVDDLTRPTPAHRVLPVLLEQLTGAGIPADRITILIGTAAHRPADAGEIERKLGPGVAARHPVVMHDFMGPDIRRVGWIEGGPVELNRHFLDAELRVCVGGVIPHNETGFGGGSKMVVPGVAGRRTIAHFHGARPPRLAGELEAIPGLVDRRAWSESVARAVGVDSVVGCVVNGRRELAGLAVGDLVDAHRAAAREAARLGRTRLPADLARRADVVVVNAYPLDTDPIQMGKSLNLARKLESRTRPTRSVVINAASDGVFYHGMGMGMGVQPARLLRNLPRWLAPREIGTWARGLARTVSEPLLSARLSYFSLNHLAWESFSAGDGRRGSSDDLSLSAPQGEADPLVYSEAFPSWGFRRKYPHGRLYRRWEELCETLDGEVDDPVVLVFPCAPLQLLEID